MLKVLNESHVSSNTNPQKLEHLVGEFLATNITTFTEEELIDDGMGHIKSLDITVGCREMIVGRVLIENGSTLNVCPVITLDRLGQSIFHQENHNDV